MKTELNKQQALDRLSSIERETLELRKIIDQKDDWTSVVDFESACKRLGIGHNEVLAKWLDADLTVIQINGLMIETCIEAVNTDESGNRWNPNWFDAGEKKWYIWFERGLEGFAVGDCFFDDCDAILGASYFYSNEEKAKHGVKYFKKYYEAWMS